MPYARVMCTTKSLFMCIEANFVNQYIFDFHLFKKKKELGLSIYLKEYE